MKPLTLYLKRAMALTTMFVNALRRGDRGLLISPVLGRGALLDYYEEPLRLVSWLLLFTGIIGTRFRNDDNLAGCPS